VALISPCGEPRLGVHTWLPEWDAPCDGPMSLLLKFFWANVMDATLISRKLFRKSLVNSSLCLLIVTAILIVIAALPSLKSGHEEAFQEE
jgi:hypothetical protein